MKPLLFVLCSFTLIACGTSYIPNPISDGYEKFEGIGNLKFGMTSKDLLLLNDFHGKKTGERKLNTDTATIFEGKYLDFNFARLFIYRNKLAVIQLEKSYDHLMERVFTQKYGEPSGKDHGITTWRRANLLLFLQQSESGFPISVLGNSNPHTTITATSEELFKRMTTDFNTFEQTEEEKQIKSKMKKY